MSRYKRWAAAILGTVLLCGLVVQAQDNSPSIRVRVPPELPVYFGLYEPSFSEGVSMMSRKVGGKPMSVYVDPDGNITLPFKNNGGRNFSDGLAVICEGPGMFSLKYGYIDADYQIVIPLQYIHAKTFSDGLAAVCTGKGQWGFINTSGKTVVPMKYDAVSAYQNGMARVEKNGKYGYVNKNGKEVVPPTYARALDFSEGLAAVAETKNGNWGFIDKSGERIIGFDYDLVTNISGQWDAAAGRDDDFNPLYFQQGLVPVRKNGKWGYINKSGQAITEFKYDEARPFSENRAGVAIQQEPSPGDWMAFYDWGFIDKTGKEVIPLSRNWSYTGPYRDGLALVQKYNGSTTKFGFINKSGKTVVPFDYDWAYDFSEGFAMVAKGQIGASMKHGYVDTDGNLVVPLEYDYACSFSEGFAWVHLGDRYDDQYGILEIVQ